MVFANLRLVLICAVLPWTVAAQALPAPLTKAQMKDFLQHAAVIHSEELIKGITRPHRLTLSDGTLTHDAVFQSIDERKSERQLDKSRRGELDFVDAYRYNIAAYALAELLGLDTMMPMSVERRWQGTTGSITWWIDDVMMDEGERWKASVKPPDANEWAEQMDRMAVFSQLVYDTDRNPENVVISKDWKVWMIDFTRAFRIWPDLESPKTLNRCDRTLLNRLRTLRKDDVQARAEGHLTSSEIKGVMARRDKLVAHFDALIAERGETAVLFESK